MVGWIVLVVVILVVVYGVAAYNNLVRQRQLSQEGWSGIDVQLKRRADLIPNLMESVKGYMGHERDTLEAVTNARAAAVSAQGGTPEQRAQAEGALSGALGRLMAVAEAYPDLKASQNFLQFQAALQQTEDELQLARRYYNGTARNLNTAVQSFPSSILAGLFHFTTVQYFEIDTPADRAVPQVKF
ncbi:MAG TPA: LemA family protein [Devosia sp.]|jgi:LemA protein|nr:LemA family protein [Devosia sp.]